MQHNAFAFVEHHSLRISGPRPVLRHFAPRIPFPYPGVAKERLGLPARWLLTHSAEEHYVSPLVVVHEGRAGHSTGDNRHSPPRVVGHTRITSRPRARVRHRFPARARPAPQPIPAGSFEVSGTAQKHDALQGGIVVAQGSGKAWRRGGLRVGRNREHESEYRRETDAMRV